MYVVPQLFWECKLWPQSLAPLLPEGHSCLGRLCMCAHACRCVGCSFNQAQALKAGPVAPPLSRFPQPASRGPPSLGMARVSLASRLIF